MKSESEYVDDDEKFDNFYNLLDFKNNCLAW